MKLRGAALEICQNKTKVGLKVMVLDTVGAIHERQNKTKVGLKDQRPLRTRR